jgi:hypothetical protein
MKDAVNGPLLRNAASATAVIPQKQGTSQHQTGDKMRQKNRSHSTLMVLPAAVALMLTACGGNGSPPPPPATAMADQAACQSLTPASVGGPMPEGDTVVIRWLGTSNFEVAYRDKVILMDTYYNRPARTRSIGIAVKDVKRADVILIGHAHGDHISDVAPVADQTKASVIGSQITQDQAIKNGVPKEQTIVVKGTGGESFKYGDITIKPTHIIHSTIQDGLTAALHHLYDVDSLGPLTPDEVAQTATVGGGSSDPNLVQQGTMGFTLELKSGFRIMWFDSVGEISPEETQLAKDIGEGVDVGIYPWTPHSIAENQLRYTWQHVSLFKPKLYLPTHHDHIWNAWLDNGLEPLFMKIRDELPATSFVSPLYRSAVCINTSGPQRGEYIVKY